VLCREHAQQLSKSPQLTEAAKLLGVVKETGVDDEGLCEFYTGSFPYQMYRNDNLQLYEAFGNRKIGLTTWNPWRLWKGYREMKQRLDSKNLTGNLKGEGLVQGGVLVFDKTGELQYAEEEQIGTEFDVDSILNAALGKPITKKSESKEL